MSENDVMTRLSEANPVRLDELPDEGLEALLDSILARPRLSRRRLVLAAAVAAAAVAAALIGVFVLTGGEHQQRTGEHQQRTELKEGTPDNSLRLGPVAGPPPRSIAISDVSVSLGAPVALPHTSAIQPADARSASADRICPVISIAGIDGTCFLTVKFPSQSVTIEYNRPTGQPGPAGFAADVQQMQEEAARHPGSGQADLLDLNGVPAMFSTGDYSLGAEGSASIHFIVGETAVTISGAQNEATLQGLAQSILDRTPSPVQVGLAHASSVLGAPIVLPQTDLVQPSDAASTAIAACSPSADAATPCQVTVDFPSLTDHYVPLTIRYVRPTPADPGVSYRNVVEQIKGAKIVSLNGVQAIFVPGPAGAYPSWLEFVAGGTDVTVQGNYDEATLQAIARSILTQSGA